MERGYTIGADTHCAFTELATISPGGRWVHRDRCPTTIQAWVQAIAEVRRPRVVVIEEGPLADWLNRGLGDRGETVVVCDPRRNHLIAKDSDKDDAMDAEKLARLARGGFIKCSSPHGIVRSGGFQAACGAVPRSSSSSGSGSESPYRGIGLERRGSGEGSMLVRVARDANRTLKNVILGAAMSAVASGRNPFAEQHRRWLQNGISPRNARRNVARSLAAVMWGLWKRGDDDRPEWVGVAAGKPTVSVGRESAVLAT